MFLGAFGMGAALTYYLDPRRGAYRRGLARNRLDHLRLELKGKEKGQTVRLGSYEQNIGLKDRLPD